MERWTAGSKRWTPRTARSCGSSRWGRGSLEIRSAIRDRTASSTWRCTRGSVVGWGRWRSPISRPTTRTPHSASRARFPISNRPPPWVACSMSSRVEWLVGAATAVALVTGISAASRRATATPREKVLAVCADPNNLPFSNDELEGFENKLADLVGRELGLPVRYTWMPQRRGFVRNTLKAGRCDVIMGVPTSFELARPTNPYYRSTYVFVYRKDRPIEIRSLDDPILKRLRIGVHVIGDDYANVPPATALAQRHIVRNVVGYTIYGDYSQPDPPARLIDAVARGDVDVAIAWGPLAGYFARRAAVPLEVVPVSPQIDVPFLPFVFDIAMAGRRGDDTLRVRLDSVIELPRAEIERPLQRHGGPLFPPPAEQ